MRELRIFIIIIYNLLMGVGSKLIKMRFEENYMSFMSEVYKLSPFLSISSLFSFSCYYKLI